MFGLGTKEIIIVAGIIVLLFGAKKIPNLLAVLGTLFVISWEHSKMLIMSMKRRNSFLY